MAWTDLPGINDASDPRFRQDFLTQLQGMLPPGMSDAQISQAIQQSSWYGKLGSGSVPYAAAHEVAQALGSATPYNQAQSDQSRQIAEGRSPEGIARANDTGGSGLSKLLKIGGLGLGPYGLGSGAGLFGDVLGGGAGIGSTVANAAGDAFGGGGGD